MGHEFFVPLNGLYPRGGLHTVAHEQVSVLPPKSVASQFSEPEVPNCLHHFQQPSVVDQKKQPLLAGASILETGS